MKKEELKRKKEELKIELTNVMVYIQYINYNKNSGTHYFKILILDRGFLSELDLIYYKDILGFRYNKKHDSISIGGYGYNKIQHIKDTLIKEFKVKHELIFEL